MLPFKVTKRYGKGGDTQVAMFKELTDATFFIEKKLADDAALKVKITYQILDGFDVMKTFEPIEEGAGGQASGGGASSAGSSAGFRPTPFNTSPRPGGVPHGWLPKDDDDTTKKS